VCVCGFLTWLDIRLRQIPILKAHATIANSSEDEVEA
jgi:hypothetical protein